MPAGQADDEEPRFPVTSDALGILLAQVAVIVRVDERAKGENRMSTMAMTAPMAGASPQLRARIAGVFYLLNFLTGSLAAVLVGRLAGYGHAALIIATACYVVVTLLLYYLFEPVSRRLSLLAAFFSLVGCAIGVLSLFHLAPFNINNLVFFGFYCLVIGYLIFRSTFMPRILGVLMALAGLGWLTFLSPPFANSLTPYNVAAALLGEGSLTLWLLVAGVNVQRWNEGASAAGIVTPRRTQA